MRATPPLHLPPPTALPATPPRSGLVCISSFQSHAALIAKICLLLFLIFAVLSFIRK